MCLTSMFSDVSAKYYNYCDVRQHAVWKECACADAMLVRVMVEMYVKGQCGCGVVHV